MAVHAVDDGYSDVLCGNGNICGRNTTGPGICSRLTPFQLRFVTDNTEAEFEHLKGSPNTRGELPHGSRGFRFGYAQRRCRPDGQDCVQCKVISDAGINEVQSCNGPHFHKRKDTQQNREGRKRKGKAALIPTRQQVVLRLYDYKIFQPYEAPTVPCLPDTFSGPSGTITYPPTGELYDRNIKCFFRITVAAGQKN